MKHQIINIISNPLSRKFLNFVLLTISLNAFCSCEKENEPKKEDNKKVIILEAKDVEKTNKTLTWVHYMPWFDSPQTTDNGNWGIHWTMSTMNSNDTTPDGKRKIASHYYPLIGPYATSDADVLEYHLLLMKYSGIDGILIDWYGVSDVNDYPAIHKNTEALVNKLKKVGLSFAIVYEDRTIPEILKKRTDEDPVDIAKQDMSFLESNYFNQSEYIKIDNQPLLLVFGPEYFRKNQWSSIFSDMSSKPCFVTYSGTTSMTQPASSGEYIWVDPVNLDSKYRNTGNFSVFIGGAYPGFNDFYKEGGWGNGYDLPYPHNNGELFRKNLQLAKTYQASYLQLITWNDFGEGTMIEPTLEFGFSFLENVQDFCGVSYKKDALESIYELYKTRKKLANNKDAQNSLEQAFYYYVSLQPEKAKNILDSLKVK